MYRSIQFWFNDHEAISIEELPNRKNPVLCIMNDNTASIVASFSNHAQAEFFITFLKRVLTGKRSATFVKDKYPRS